MSIIHGDCVEVMQGMDPDSIDAIVCDPPYGLEFMGKEWDRLDEGLPQENVWKGRRGGGSAERDPTTAGGRHAVTFGGGSQGFKRCQTCGKRAFSGSPCECPEPDYVTEYNYGPSSQSLRMGRWHQRWATEALRVAKPGAYLLAFGGTRTVHRLTVALEDAGWIIRDMLVWAYASGFPKSRALLKPAWEPIVMARKPGPLRDLDIDGCRIGVGDGGTRDGETNATTRYGDNGLGFQLMPGPRGGSAAGRWPANVVLTDAIFDGNTESVVGGGKAGKAGIAVMPMDDMTYGDTGTYSRFFLVPKASRRDREPAVTAYCTCETVKLGAWESEGQGQPDQTASTSRGRAISEATSRVGFDSLMSSNGSDTSDLSHRDSRSTTSTATSKTTASRTYKPSTPSLTSGSTPAASSSTVNGGNGVPSASSIDPSMPSGGTSAPKAGHSTDVADPATSVASSSPSVCADCGLSLPDQEGGDAGRRGRVNVHPTQTVKPTELMRHLIRLVTPEGGTVLDPFLGSGTTAKAATLEGVEWVGIEREAEYIRIAEQRLVGVEPEPRQMTMDMEHGSLTR